MKVNDYLVKWRYDETSLQFNYVFEFRETTTCKIFNKKHDLLGEGHAILNPCDTKDKNIARKTSLARALINFSKEERKIFWEMYRTSTIIPRWEK